MKLSPQQKLTLQRMKEITHELNATGKLNWFHSSELAPEITLHSFTALVCKGLIEKIELETNGQHYYRIRDDALNIKDDKT